MIYLVGASTLKRILINYKMMYCVPTLLNSFCLENYLLAVEQWVDILFFLFHTFLYFIATDIVINNL